MHAYITTQCTTCSGGASYSYLISFSAILLKALEPQTKYFTLKTCFRRAQCAELCGDCERYSFGTLLLFMDVHIDMGRWARGWSTPKQGQTHVSSPCMHAVGSGCGVCVCVCVGGGGGGGPLWPVNSLVVAKL